MAKAKGKDKPAASTVPTELEEATGDDVAAESSPSVPLKMEEETTVDAGSDKTEEADKSEEVEKLNDAEMEEEVNEDEKVETAMATDTPGDEKLEEGDKKEEVKSDGNVEIASKKKGRRQRKWKKKKATDAGTPASDPAEKPETSDPAKKGLKKADGTGLIFMCNSKTKKDCFQYKVFGLPENKKELVAKVYKGMRLFLYNIDDKMMYGIFKATSPGGYNLEPKAFKAGFPSQVRFAVLDDCKPLPEEKFKAAIKANYSGRNQFKVELSRDQVNNLCKLFTNETKTKGSKQKKSGGRGEASRAPVSAGRDWNRRPPPRDFQQRNAPYYLRAPTYAPEIVRQAALPPPLYAYERPVDDYYYRRELPPPVEYRDPYSLYREPPSYREPVYPQGLSYAPLPPPNLPSVPSWGRFH